MFVFILLLCYCYCDTHHVGLLYILQLFMVLRPPDMDTCYVRIVRDLTHQFQAADSSPHHALQFRQLPVCTLVIRSYSWTPLLPQVKLYSCICIHITMVRICSAYHYNLSHFCQTKMKKTWIKYCHKNANCSFKTQPLCGRYNTHLHFLSATNTLTPIISLIRSDIQFFSDNS